MVSRKYRTKVRFFEFYIFYIYIKPIGMVGFNPTKANCPLWPENPDRLFLKILF